MPYSWETRRKYLDLPFPLSEYESRIKRIRKKMENHGIEAILIFGNASDAGDLVYVANYIPFGRAALILGREGPPVIVSDALLHGEPINSYTYLTWVEDFIPVHHDPVEFARTMTKALEQANARNIGIVGMDNLPMTIWDELKENSGERFRCRDFWLEFSDVKSLRSPAEIDLLRELGRITVCAMKAAIGAVEECRTEQEVASVANKTMLEEGAHDRAFSTIVNGRPRGGLKHTYPSGTKIQKGDLVYLDMGAMKYGYQCDMSRSVVVGGAREEQRWVLDTVLTAYKILTAMMRPRVRTSELMSKAKQLEDESGLRSKYAGRAYLGFLVHHAIASSFYGIPSLGLSDAELREGMSFAFEPMAHILDFGTAVIEDIILITKTGAESLTPFDLVHW